MPHLLCLRIFTARRLFCLLVALFISLSAGCDSTPGSGTSSSLTSSDKRISTGLSQLDRSCNYIVLNYTRGTTEETLSILARRPQDGISYLSMFVESDTMQGVIDSAKSRIGKPSADAVGEPAADWDMLAVELWRLQKHFYMIKLEKNSGWVIYAHRREEGDRAGYGMLIEEDHPGPLARTLAGNLHKLEKSR